jgi:beta-alanine--pyruvate transaminase
MQALQMQVGAIIEDGNEAGEAHRAPPRLRIRGPEYVPELANGFTYSGHPLGVAAAADAALDVYADEVCSSVRGNSSRSSPTPFITSRTQPTSSAFVQSGAPGIDLAPGLRGMRAFESAFFDEDLVIRSVGDMLVLAPSLIATEEDVAMTTKIARILAWLR